MPASRLDPLRNASRNSVQRAAGLVGWVQRQLSALESALQPRQSGPAAFSFDLTRERLEVIKHVEASAPIWRAEDYPVSQV